MDMILTGKTITADEAERSGLIARVLPDAEVLETAVASGKLMGNYSRPILYMAKEAVNAGTLVPRKRHPQILNYILLAEEMSLSQGVQ